MSSFGFGSPSPVERHFSRLKKRGLPEVVDLAGDSESEAESPRVATRKKQKRRVAPGKKARRGFGGIEAIDDEAELAAAVASLDAEPDLATGRRLDVTSEADWREAVAWTVDTRGSLDVLVNCAGIAAGDSVADTQLETWRRVFAVNLEGALLGGRR